MGAGNRFAWRSPGRTYQPSARSVRCLIATAWCTIGVAGGRVRLGRAGIRRCRRSL